MTRESGSGVRETPTWPEHPPPDWVTYHLAHPGTGRVAPWDPNCAVFWRGRYHLFYIHPGRTELEDSYAHVSSADMVHWRWHPTTLTPATTGHGMWSGTAFLTKDDRVAIIYQGHTGEIPGRNFLAFSDDDELERWSVPVPVEPHVRPGQDGSLIDHWDPDGWLDGDTYYAVFGGHNSRGKPATLHRSSDLSNWEYVGPFLGPDASPAPEDLDITGPNFFPIGGKHMLLCISEADPGSLGARYYIGRWRDETFVPETRGRMNWHGWDLFAVESLLTPDGRRVMWGWCAGALAEVPVTESPQRGVQCLPRELSLPEDGILRIRPLPELESLRTGEARFERLRLVAGRPLVLDGVSGDALEIDATIRAGSAGRVGVVVHAGPDGRGGVPVAVDPTARTLSIGDVVAPVDLVDEQWIRLRVFVDKHVVEAFANDRQAIVAFHARDPDSVHVALLAEGGEAEAEATAWRMRSAYVPSTASR